MPRECVDTCACRANFKPVCGKDGNTYDRKCLKKCFAAKVNCFSDNEKTG